MNIIDQLTINRFHDYRSQQYGEGTVESLGWFNLNDQQKRFEVLSTIANLNGKIVLDVGCGHGDLFPYLEQTYPDLNYVGIEQNTSFLETAHARFKDNPRVQLLLGDFTSAELPEHDFTLCCGAFNYKNQDEDFLKNVLTKLYENCKVGLGFNLLSNVINSEGILKSYEANQVIKLCKKLSNKVEIHQGYLADDFTVFLYKK